MATQEHRDPHRPVRHVVAGLAGADEDSLVRHARVRRDAGDEVIWAGAPLTPDQVAAVAVSEDADRVTVDPAGAALTVERAIGDLGVRDIGVTGLDPHRSPTDG